MNKHKTGLEFHYLASLVDAINCHTFEGNLIKFNNLFDKKKREIFKRHINESFSNQSKELFFKQDHLQHYAEQHESLINEVITQTNILIDEKQGNLCQVELFKTACNIINK